MALLLKRVNSKGMATEYHKVNCFVVDNKNKMVTAYITHYTNESYRKNENDAEVARQGFLSRQADIDKMDKDMDVLIEKNKASKKNPYDDEEKGKFYDEVVALSEKINKTHEEHRDIGFVPEVEPMHIDESVEEIEFVVDKPYSYSVIYETLKLGTYKGAKDV